MKKKEELDRIMNMDEELAMRPLPGIQEVDALIKILQKLSLEDIKHLRSALWLVGGEDIHSPDYKPERQIFDNKYYFYKEEGEFRKADIDTILYLEAKDNYIYLHYPSGKHIAIRSTLEGIWRELPNDEFIRINRTYCVAFKHITAFNKEYVKLGELQLPVSKLYYPILEERMEFLRTYAIN